MKTSNGGIRAILGDWTFLGTIVAAVALIASAEFGRVTPNTTIVSTLVAVWVIVVVLQYARILEVLREVKANREEVASELTSLKARFSDIEVAKKLPLISLHAFAEREAALQAGDSVLVFANTLEIDFRPMFDVVVANLQRGVSYRYLLFETDHRHAWEKFVRILRNRGVTNLPNVLFERSQIASLVKSSSVIYDFEAHGKTPEGYCVLETSTTHDTCVVMSADIAAQTRDAFYRAWSVLSANRPEGGRSTEKGHKGAAS
jgi:hypothetical protein